MAQSGNNIIIRGLSGKAVPWGTLSDGRIRTRPDGAKQI